jgi:hypothetical protein
MSTITLSYRELQSALKQLPECAVARNKNFTTLAAEYTRITGTTVTKSAPTKKAAKCAKAQRFSWDGLATDRKDAVKTLKAFRETGTDIQVKLNATNVALKAALERIATPLPVAGDTPEPTTTPEAKPVTFDKAVKQVAPHGFRRDGNGKLVARKAPKAKRAPGAKRAIAAARPTTPTLVIKPVTPVVAGASCPLSDADTPEARTARLEYALANRNGKNYQPWNEKSSVKVYADGTTRRTYTRTMNARPA